MKDITTAKTVYDRPEARVINVDIQSLVCTSQTGRSNEPYEDGDTSGWYGNN